MNVKTTKKSSKYSPATGSSRSSYLILHLGAPITDIADTEPPRLLKCPTIIQEASRHIGIKTQLVNLEMSGSLVSLRYLFHFPYFRRDDNKAILIAESLLYAISILNFPFLSRDQNSFVFRIPSEVVRHKKSIPVDLLEEIEENRNLHERVMEFPAWTLGAATYLSSTAVNAGWKITPIIVENESIYHASRFLKTSYDNCYLAPGELHEVSRHPDAYNPRTGFEKSLLEIALLNAFKSVEAVIGDPPKDDGKFFSKIRAIGLNPNETVGYANKTPLHQVIRDMNNTRDKKSAHGITRFGDIAITEITEYQACARFIFLSAIENLLGEAIF